MISTKDEICRMTGIRTGCLCFVVGCAAALYWPWPLDIATWFLLFLCLTGVAGVLFPRLVWCGGFVAGLAWTLLQSQDVLSQRLPQSLAGQAVVLVGTIASLPEQSTHRVRFLFEVQTIEDASGGVHDLPMRLRLNWYRNAAQVVPGEQWQLSVKLKEPYGFANPGGFDYETWLFSHRIGGTGYVRDTEWNRRLRDAQAHYFARLRHHLSRKFAEYSNHLQYAGPIRALAIGDRGGMSDAQWSVLRGTGTNHLLAISGLHIGLFSGFVFFLGRIGWSLLPCLSTRLPARYFATLLAMVAALGYAGMAGFSLPTQRACIMLCLFLSGTLLGRQWRISLILAVTLFAVLLRDPLSLLAVDFWLSFLAVFIIVHLCSGRQGSRWSRGQSMYRMLRLQFLIPLALAPFLLFWFQEFAAYALLANVVAIPVVGWLVVPLVMLACFVLLCLPTLAEPLLVWVDTILTFVFSWLSVIGQWPHAVWSHPAPSLWSVVLAGIGMLLLLAPRALPARGLGVFFFLPLLVPVRHVPPPGYFHLHLLDVGQGLSAVIHTQKHVLVYDTGDAWSSRFDAGSSVIVPFLRKSGLCNVDVLILSHADRDHTGGAKRLVESCPPAQLLSNASFADPVPKPCVAGAEWVWDGVHFSILHPATAEGPSDNDHSCVLRVRQKDMTVLLPGDIEALGEKHLLATTDDSSLHAEVLVAPHHGSRSSSSLAFIEAVQPQIVLFPVGHRNRFHFPDRTIMDRYRKTGARLYSSAASGSLWISRDNGLLKVQEYRRARQRFWHAIPVSLDPLEEGTKIDLE